MDNKITNLDEFRPKRSSFKCQKNGKTYLLNELSASVESLIRQKFGADVLTLLSRGNKDAIFEVVYRLIDDTQKADFAAVTVDEYDEHGDKVQVKIGGVERLKRMLTGGPSEEVELVNGLMVAISGKTAEELTALEKGSQAPVEPKKKPKTK